MKFIFCDCNGNNERAFHITDLYNAVDEEYVCLKRKFQGFPFN